MAKTTAPLLSFGADGQIAKTMVYSKWKGIPYVRRHVVPANPQTVAQQLTRTTFSQLREMWKVAPAIAQLPWDTFAIGRPFLGLNKWVGENLRVVRGEPDFANFIGSPGARGGPAATSTTITPGGSSGEIDVAWITPTPPSGWTLVAAQAFAFEDQIPGGIFTGEIVAEEDTATMNAVTFTGLTGGTDYVVTAFLKWTKPNGDLAFSVSVTDIVAATV